MTLPERRSPGGIRRVRGPLTEADLQRIRSAGRRWWGPIAEAALWYRDNPDPTSLVEPWWVPVQWLASVFQDHIDAEDLAVAILGMVSETILIERTLMIGGVQYPVVKVENYVRARAVHPGMVELPGGARLALGSG